MSDQTVPDLGVNGITAGYGRLRALDDVALDVPGGSVVGVLGPNGAGKSTLLRVISGLLKPWSGTITLGDSDITGTSASERARSGICLIPEGRAVFPGLTVSENIALHAGRRSLAGAALERVAEIFPVLAERRRQVAGTLSGGQQQMLALSRAFVKDPKVIIGDELSLGLAPIIIDEIFDALAMLRADGRSLLLVEQYADRVLKIADRVYILSQGAVNFAGAPSEISGDMFDRYAGAASPGRGGGKGGAT